MGKVRIKHLGIEDLEREEKERRKRQREQKKKRLGRVPGLKGGERLVEMTSEEEIEKLVKISQEEEKVRQELKTGQKEKAKKAKPKLKKKRQRSRAWKQASLKVDKGKRYPIEQAVKLLKQVSLTRFNGTVEIHLNTRATGIRGTVNLPHGTGKKLRVAIADETLIEKVKSGNIDFDVLVAHPSMMTKLAKIAKILGPKGLMPNPKAGTISDKPEKLAKELQDGRIEYKTESKFPIIHQVIGKLDFEDKKLVENFEALIAAVGKKNIKSATLASTMSPGIKVEVKQN